MFFPAICPPSETDEPIGEFRHRAKTTDSCLGCTERSLSIEVQPSETSFRTRYDRGGRHLHWSADIPQHREPFAKHARPLGRRGSEALTVCSPKRLPVVAMPKGRSANNCHFLAFNDHFVRVIGQSVSTSRNSWPELKGGSLVGTESMPANESLPEATSSNSRYCQSWRLCMQKPRLCILLQLVCRCKSGLSFATGRISVRGRSMDHVGITPRVLSIALNFGLRRYAV